MGCLCPASIKRMLGMSHGQMNLSKSFGFQSVNDDKFFTFPGYSGNVNTINEIIKSKSDTWPKHSDYLKAVFTKFEALLVNVQSCITEPSEQKIDKLFGWGNCKSIDSPENDSPLSNSNNLSELLRTSMTQQEQLKGSLARNFRKRLIIEVQRGQLGAPKTMNLEQFPLEKPIVELELTHPDFEDKITYPEKYIKGTKMAGDDLAPMWFEVIDFDISKIIDNPDKGTFTLRLIYKLKNSKKTQQVGADVSFSLAELRTQELIERAINVKSEDGRKFVAQILMRCQLGWDVLALLRKWRNELEIKLEILNRMLDRVDEVQKVNQTKILVNDGNKNFSESRRQNDKSIVLTYNLHNTQIGNSLISNGTSTMNNSGLYDNPYIIK